MRTNTWSRAFSLAAAFVAVMAPAAVAAATPVHAAVSLPIRALINVTPVHQEYGLDCEAASLQMALAAVGIVVTQDSIINDIGADLRPPVMSGGLPVRWGDPYQTFVGHVNGAWLQTGYGVYYPPIVAAAEAAGATAFGREGWSAAQLYEEVAEGHPVVVRVPHLMYAPTIRHWTAWDGRSVWYSPQDHAQVLMGYDYGAGTVTLADPFDGQVHTYAMGLFESRFAAFGSQAIAVSLPNGPSAIVSTAGGDQTLFWRGSQSTLYEAWTNAGAWGSPVPVSGAAATPMASAPSAAVTAAGQQLVFWQGTDGLLHEMWWNAADGWHGPVIVGSGFALVSAPSILVTETNQTVFWQAPSGQLEEAWWTLTGGWNGPVYVAGAIGMTSSPAAISGSAMNQTVFWKGAGGELEEAWWTPGHGWTGPVPVAGGVMAMSTAPAAVTTGSGEQIVFWQAGDRSLREAAWSYPAWSGVVDLGLGPLGSSPSADLDPHGGRHVFWRGTDGNAWTAVGVGGTWTVAGRIGLGPLH